MKVRTLAIAFTFAVGLAGVSNARGDESIAFTPAVGHPLDPIVTSFERDLNRQAVPSTPATGKGIEADALYLIVNRPLQTLPCQPVTLVAAPDRVTTVTDRGE